MSRISLLLLTFCFVATSTYALETEQKNEEWAADIRQAVVSAVEKAPELSERETLIYSSLMELPPLGSAISLDQSLSLKEMFNDLVSEGSYPAFLQAIEDNVELEAFLRQRRIIPTHPTCNCSVSGWFECNDGWECADTTCTSAEGSTHSGVCVKEEDNLSNVFGPTFDTSFLLN